MTDQRDPNQVTDAGTPPPTAPAANPNVNTPSGAPATGSTPNSNAPDADTAAGASIPKALIDNPAVPTQKMADQADANKNSPAPHHEMLRKAAEALAGGPMTTTRYDTDGTAIRTPVQPSLAHLGLALALDVLKGGMAGGTKPAGQGAQAFQAGADVVTKQRQDLKQAQIDQDAQAKADQNHKTSVMEANLRNHQTASLVGKEDEATAKTYSDGFAALSEPLMDGTQTLPEGVTMSEPQFETDAVAAIKNGKTNVTKDFLMPVGDPVPMRDSNGNPVMKDGHQVFGHNYVTVHGADKFQSSLTPDLMSKLQSVGYFTQDGKPAKINPDQPWSFADLAKKTASYASIMAGESIMQRHKDDAHDILGKEQEDMGDLSAAVRKDPTTRKAVELFARAAAGAGNDNIEDILHTMMKTDPNSAGIIMDHLGLKSQDLQDIMNKRIEAHTEATTKEPQAKPLTPEEAADKKADVQLKLSQVGKNNADRDKAEADTKKILGDTGNHDAIVDAMGTGHVAAANLAFMLRSKEGQALVTDVTKKYPDFDSSKAAAYPKEYDDYTSQKKGSAGFAINSGGTAFQHLNEMLALNTNASHVYGTPAYIAYKNKMDTVVSELGQFYGNTTIPGLQDFKDTLSATLPGNRETAIRTQAKSMGDKMNSYEHGWANAAPSAAYQAPLPGLSSDALHARANLDPSFAARRPEGAKFTGKGPDGRMYWLNAAKKPIQEMVQGAK